MSNVCDVVRVFRVDSRQRAWRSRATGLRNERCGSGMRHEKVSLFLLYAAGLPLAAIVLIGPGGDPPSIGVRSAPQFGCDDECGDGFPSLQQADDGAELGAARIERTRRCRRSGRSPRSARVPHPDRAARYRCPTPPPAPEQQGSTARILADNHSSIREVGLGEQRVVGFLPHIQFGHAGPVTVSTPNSSVVRSDHSFSRSIDSTLLATGPAAPFRSMDPSSHHGRSSGTRPTWPRWSSFLDEPPAARTHLQHTARGGDERVALLGPGPDHGRCSVRCRAASERMSVASSR